ncbi:hypothetical protein PV325_012041 [Microctonus aethiopoides]|nr:hypothetical protein PV325_012041 [Microctonus aethiopoides]
MVAILEKQQCVQSIYSPACSRRGLSCKVNKASGQTTAACHRACHQNLQEQTLPGIISFGYSKPLDYPDD